MAWNKYYLFITNPSSKDLPTILNTLQLSRYTPVKEVSLDATNKPQTLFAGFYNGHLLLVHPALPFEFSTDTPSETEQLFINAFPGSEITALVENSTVGLFSYAVIQNGQKIRMKDGADGEIYHDTGEWLPEENEVSSQPIYDVDELEEMRADGMAEDEVEAMIAFEASWWVPNLLIKRYLGEPVWSIDTARILLTQYEEQPIHSSHRQ